MIVNLSIGLAMGLIAIGIIGIMISGVRNVINGNSDFKKIVIMIVPVIVFAITYTMFGTAAQAVIATMLFMVALMLLSILVTGTRGTFNF